MTGFLCSLQRRNIYCSTIWVSKRGQSCMVLDSSRKQSVGGNWHDRAPGRMRPGAGMLHEWLFLLLATSSFLTSSKMKWVMCFFGSRSFKMWWRTARIGAALLPYLCFWCAAKMKALPWNSLLHWANRRRRKGRKILAKGPWQKLCAE